MKEIEKLENDLKRNQSIKDNLITHEQLYQKDLPPTRWIAEDLIPNGITILSASPGQHKTWLMLQMAIQIAKDEPVFNYFKTEGDKRKGVLFINEESNEKMLQDRLKLLIPDKDKTDIPVYFLNLFGIKVETDIETLVEFCKENDIKLVIFDSLTRIHNFSENDAGDIKKIYEKLLAFVRADISCLLSHHHRKANVFGASKNISDELRGSVDLLAQIDCHLAIDNVDTDKNYLTIKQPKLRSGINLDDFRINIVNTKDSISFIYGGKFTLEDIQMVKTEEARDIILGVIKDIPEITKDGIFRKLKGKVGIGTIKLVLPKLEKEELIFSKTRKPKKYLLKDQIQSFLE